MVFPQIGPWPPPLRCRLPPASPWASAGVLAAAWSGPLPVSAARWAGLPVTQLHLGGDHPLVEQECRPSDGLSQGAHQPTVHHAWILPWCRSLGRELRPTLSSSSIRNSACRPNGSRARTQKHILLPGCFRIIRPEPWQLPRRVLERVARRWLVSAGSPSCSWCSRTRTLASSMTDWHLDWRKEDETADGNQLLALHGRRPEFRNSVPWTRRGGDRKTGCRAGLRRRSAAC